MTQGHLTTINPIPEEQAMILSISIALLPVLFISVMTIRDLRPWWRQYKLIHALPERQPPTRHTYAAPLMHRRDTDGSDSTDRRTQSRRV
jgi:hypothetical protein